MTNERRLGRGLEALLSRTQLETRPDDGQPSPEQAHRETPVELHSQSESPAGGLVQLNVYEIEKNPYQPRHAFDEDTVAEMAESIKRHGLLQPIVVRRQGIRYQLISGERRVRAAIKAGLTEIPAQLRQADDQEMSELAIVENLHRKDLNALEKAAAFQGYLDQFKCTQEELAGRLHIDRSTIANLIRLLELPDDIQDAVRASKISPGHARALLPLDDETRQRDFAARIERDGLSVRATEQLVQETIRGEDQNPLEVVGGDPAPAKPTRSEHVAALEQDMRTAMGTRVDIKQTAAGKGKFVIHFSSHEEFQRLHDHICGPQWKDQAG